MSTDIKPGQVWAWQDTYDAKGPHGSLIEIIEAGTDVTYQYRDAAGFDPEQTRAASAELIRANANLVRCHCRAGTEDTCDQHSTAPAPLDPSPEIIDAVNVLRDAGIRSAEDFDRLVAHQPAPEPEKDLLAETIWKASRADEGTISATGANHVAAAIRNLFVVIDPAAVDWRGLQSQMSVLVVGAEPFKRAGDILDVVRRELGIEATR